MSGAASIEPDAGSAAAGGVGGVRSGTNAGAAATPIDPVALDLELAPEPVLPREHPSWARDALMLSARARALVGARLRPVVIAVIRFWDHRVHELALGGGRRLTIDIAGSYRIE